MKIECQFMELLKPLFLAGTNYGEKLKEQSGKGTLRISFDEEKNRSEIHDSKGFYTYVGIAGIFTWEPKQEKKLAVVVNKSHDMSVNVPVRAQVGGPQDVFRTAQVETPMDKVQVRRGRPARYQGEEPAE